jgi:hypothetical protein
MWEAVILVFQISTNQVTMYKVADFRTRQACLEFVAASESDPDEDFIIGGACHPATDRRGQ